MNLKFYLDPKLKAQDITFEPPKFGDAGFDIKSGDDYTIQPGEQILISTGLKIAIPEGWVGIIRERSSTGMKRLYTHAGVIDSNYRGEVKVIIANGGSAPYEVIKGDKIAQLLVLPCLVEGEEVLLEQDLGNTQRGEKGFGSSGR